MKCIANKIATTIEIQKSKFICILTPIHSLEDVKQNLENIKGEYKGATHYCFGYILDQTKRFSDDGEPSGTAGMPILKVLESQELDHILAVVVRYFGGTKLGAGGLVRAYTNSVTHTLEKVDKIELIAGNKVEITFSYNQEKRIENIIHPYPILEKRYEEKIHYILFLPNQYLSDLSNFSYQILEDNIFIQEKRA